MFGLLFEWPFKTGFIEHVLLNMLYNVVSTSCACWKALSCYIEDEMRVHVLLNLLIGLRKRDKMRGLPSILSLFRNEFNKFNNT